MYETGIVGVTKTLLARREGSGFKDGISLDSCMDCSKWSNLSVNSVKSSRCNGYLRGL